MAMGAPSPAEAASAPARQVASSAAELVQQAFNLHHLADGAECGREELLLGDLCLVSAAELVAGLGRPDVEAEFSLAAMAAATGASPVPHLQRAVELAGDALTPSAGDTDAAPGTAAPMDELELLEARLASILDSDPPSVAGPMGGLLRAGGKRLRPRLSFLWSSLGGRHNPPPRPPLAASSSSSMTPRWCTTTSSTTVLCGAASRPSTSPTGRPPRCGVGDYYFGRAAELLAGLGSPEVTRIAIDAVVRVCRAQLEEYRSRSGVPVDEARYLRTVEARPPLSSRARAPRARPWRAAPAPWGDAAAAYGLELGVAFQVADDLIDFSPRSGKALAQDLRQGVTSLPCSTRCRTRARRRAQPPGGRRCGRPERALGLVRGSGAMGASPPPGRGLPRPGPGSAQRSPRRRGARAAERDREPGGGAES